MTMRIEVELSDGATCCMAPAALNLFLVEGMVTRFRRADGWAVVGVDPIRSGTGWDSYAGEDRRKSCPICMRVYKYEENSETNG